MSFQTAVATNFADLMTRIQTFLNGTGHAFGKTFTGTGTGDLVNYNGTATSVAETWTITATSATNFTVVGSVSGAQAAATVGTPYSNARIAFTITAGGTAYIAGDIWRIQTSPRWTLSRPFNGSYPGDRTFSGGWTNGANIFDQNPGTAATATVFPQTAGVRIIASAEIREVGITTPIVAQAPTAFTVQWSDDGSTWTTAQTFSGLTTGWILGVMRRFAVPAAGNHLWWRVNFTAAASATLSIAAVDFYLNANSQDTLSNDWPHFIVQAPGNDGTLANAFFVVGAFAQPATDTYALAVAHCTTFDPLASYSSQPGIGNFAIVASSNGAQTYWITANGRRFCGTVKASTTYHCFYAGLMLPYARPSAYPLPVFVGGSVSLISVRWSSSDQITAHNFWRCADTGGQAFVRDIAGTWRSLATHANNTSPTSGASRMYPNALSGGGASLSIVRENFGGGYPLLPIVPLISGVGPMGELDGFFWTTGFGTAAENIIRENRIDHLVLQNVSRNTAGDYAAQRLD